MRKIFRLFKKYSWVLFLVTLALCLTGNLEKLSAKVRAIASGGNAK